MKLSLNRFHRLRWKLAFSYFIFPPLVLLTASVVICLLVLVIILLFFVPPLVLYGMQQFQGSLDTYFVRTDVPNQQTLAGWINNLDLSYQGYTPDSLVVITPQGVILAARGPKAPGVGSGLVPLLPAPIQHDLAQVLSGKSGSGGLVTKGADGTIVAIVPILSPQHRVVGALFDDTGSGIYGQETLFWLKTYLIYTLIGVGYYLIIGAISGLIGGFLTARSITRRFDKLVLAADQWSRGDFSLFVQDASEDEIGQLTRKMNRMAEQLQHLLQVRQKLAVLEERNRLARELHDSVKQHLFVTALQVGTAKRRLGPEHETIQQPLGEAERMLQQVQEELKTLIRELRPVVLEGRELSEALREYVAQWTRQTGIDTRYQTEGTPPPELPLLLEEALYRVAQEALANVVRHSQASAVELHLCFAAGSVTLTISDNGQGFDPARQRGSGVGLRSMEERMKTAGGTLMLESVPGKGTCVKAQVEVS